MNRFLEIAALSAGGLSLCLAGYAACAKITGHGEEDVRAFGRWLAGDPVQRAHAESSAPRPLERPTGAPVEASLSILSAWTLSSPYTSEELASLAGELEAKHAELDELRRIVAQRGEALERDAQACDARLRELEDLRTRLEGLRDDLTRRELELSGPASLRGETWKEVAAVLETLEDPSAAARRLEGFGPADAARILAAFEDSHQAGLVLNAVSPERWMEYVAAYSAERTAARLGRSSP